MKVFYLTVIASISVNAAFAQIVAPKLKFDKPLFNKPVENKTITLPGKANKVYTLPLDNMPCLVTDIRTLVPMPNAVTTFKNTMPNALEEKEIIPAQHDLTVSTIPPLNIDDNRNLVLESLRSQSIKNKNWAVPNFPIKRN